MDLERAPAGGAPESGVRIACLAAESSIQTDRIEVWRCKGNDQPTLRTVQRYLVFGNLPRRLNVPMFAERVGTEDSSGLRKHLGDHVFIVKERPDKGRWVPKARALERLVFLSSS
jgi:hypothetical protein